VVADRGGKIKKGDEENQMKTKLMGAAIALALALPVCAPAQQKPEALAEAAVDRGYCDGYGMAGGQTGDTPAPHGFDVANLDRSVNPCVNFYLFANGGWMAKNPIPPAYPSWSTFNQLQNHNQDALHKILDAAAANTAAPKESTDQKLGDFYATCMDASKIEAEGLKPLQPEIDRIARLSNLQEMQREVARLQTMRVGVLFDFGSDQDFKDSTKEIGDASQGGLGLPNRDYYTKDDDKSKSLRDAYVAHMTRMLVLAGDDSGKAATEAATILKIETALAQKQMTPVELRDPDNVYHLMDRGELKALAGPFSWDTYFDDIGFPNIAQVNLEQPEYFKALGEELSSVALDDWKAYLRWHLIHAEARALSDAFVNEDFDFYGKTLTGTKELLPRWKRCVQATDRELGEALGQAYVRDYFPPEAKAAALDMVHHLIATLHADILTLDWMGEDTKKQAIVKLDAIALKIGYPDKWRDYSAFEVDRGPYVLNVIRGNQFEFRRGLTKIGKPVDRTEWGMTPPTVNAYYNAQMNEIVFPAGIMQPPFFDPKADPALNYGGMGAVIGHEMTHGFDDEGAKFDAQGNLRNWWTEQDKKNFEERGNCIAKQFDAFVVEKDLHENGKLVEGESIADLGGLTLSYAAFEGVQAEHPQAAQIDGFTPEQRFFLGFAQIWASNIRPEYARLIVNTNPHPLGEFRTIAPLSNMPSFQKAWGCKDGDPMVRPAAERCRIW
jgi:putative endopeptidase